MGLRTRRRHRYRHLLASWLALALLSAGVLSAEDTIPRIADITPAPGAPSVDVFGPIRITFTTPMQAAAAEAHFSLFPPADGTFRWHEQTLEFIPRQPLIPSTRYIVSFSESLRAQSGLPLAVTYFSTGAMGVFADADDMIYLINPANEQHRNLTRGRDPAWSRDNRNIYFSREGELWEVALDGQHPRLLLGEPSLRISQPTANPRLAVVAFNGSNEAGIDNVYAYDHASEGVRQLTSFYEPATISQLAWSPDGLYVAFLRDAQIWIMNQDGANVRRLTTDDIPCTVNFAWSPGGTRIAFAGEQNIWVCDIYSLELRKLSFDDRRTGWMDWSHSNRIAYESTGLVIMEADGSSEQRLTTGGRRPAWVGTTQRLSFVLPLQTDTVAAQLWIMDPETQQKEKIADTAIPWPSVAWSRDATLVPELP